MSEPLDVVVVGALVDAQSNPKMLRSKGVEAALFCPCAFAAVTTTRTSGQSDWLGVYVGSTAPGMSVHVT
jgi:hypothetical protein